MLTFIGEKLGILMPHSSSSSASTSACTSVSNNEPRLKYKDYSSHCVNLRQRDFKQLDNHCYLDMAGASPYPTPVIDSYTRDLTSNLYGNPHSNSSPSAISTATRIQHARRRILQYFDADPSDFHLIFIKNASEGIKLVGEMITSPEMEYWFLDDSHTSIVGLREMFGSNRWRCISSDIIFRLLDSPITDSTDNRKLLSFPAQSNFSGKRYPLHWIDGLRDRKVLTLLDASSLVTTTRLSLKQNPADFTVLSLYKIFGFPTGVGCLIVRKPVVPLLNNRRRFFGGGTVAALDVQSDFVVLREDFASRYEDGTLSYLDIVAVHHSLDYFESNLDHTTISNHSIAVAQYLYDELSFLVHSTSAKTPLIHFYSSRPLSSSQGPIITFNLLKPNSEFVGFSTVSKLTNSANIHLRTGCFCNTGACAAAFGLSSEQIRKNSEVQIFCYLCRGILS